MSQHPLNAEQKPQVNSNDFMRLQEDWLKFLKDWSNALRIILAPVPFLLIIAAIALVYIQSEFIYQAPTSSWSATVNVFTTVVISLTTAIAGAVIYDKWRHMSERSVLLNKGRSAVRGLNLLLSFSVGLSESIERDARSSEVLQGDVDVYWMRHVFEKLSRESDALSRHIIAAMEEWEDIVPEVQNQSSRINQWEEMRKKLDVEKNAKETLEIQILDAEKEVQSISEGREKERSDAEANLQQLRIDLTEKINRIRALEQRIDDSILIARTSSPRLTLEHLAGQPSLPQSFGTYERTGSVADMFTVPKTNPALRLVERGDDK